jgi:Ca2+-binding EF-hand superfamily protein/peroxiredoxin
MKPFRSLIFLGLCASAVYGQTGAVEARFRQLDRNQDGKVSREETAEVPAIGRLVVAADKDGDGAATLEEIQAILRAIPAQTPRTEKAEASTRIAPEPQPESQPIAQGPRILKASDHGIGRLVPDLEYTDLQGRTSRVGEFGDSQAVVIALTSTTCPLSQKFAPSLARLQSQYQPRKVRFVFLDPIATDTPDALRDFAARHGFQGPVVCDAEGRIATALNATTTTEVFVLDRSRTLVYRGAVSDQYGLGYALDAPRHSYLSEALNAVLAGQTPAIAATEAPGCDLGFEPVLPSTTPITYHNRISRIIQNACLECHRDGGVAPFSLAGYDEVAAHKGMIRRVVERGVMPPWFAAPPEAGHPSPWANDRSLAARDKADLLAWLASDMPLGDPADAPLSRTFPKDWTIGEPDATFQLPEPVSIKAEGVMPYVIKRVPTNFKEDHWVDAIEVQPTARDVTHHVLVFVLPPGASQRDIADERGGFFGIYVPGNSTLIYPEGFARKIPAGATLMFQLHYTPNGTATTDQTRIGFRFAKSTPKHEVKVAGIANPRLSIPPGATNHAETARVPIPTDVKVLAFLPHMHLRARACKYELVQADGTKRTLLDVPRYDFNWQLYYRLAEPVDASPGDRIEFTGWYDNSEANPANPDPKKTVRWGPQTFDEMLLGYVEYYVDGPLGQEGRLGGRGGAATFLRNAGGIDGLFKQLDRDGNGKIDRDELPNPERFRQFDRNGDGAITLDEARAVMGGSGP